jgi:hypothetical protein
MLSSNSHQWSIAVTQSCLHKRGDWIPHFEELVRYADREVPRDEGILLLPGEDPFYYATGRRPQFPVLLFDHTVNPYSPEELLQIARQRNIRWLIIKQDLQDEDEHVEQERDRITEVLEQDFEQVESLSNYDIYHRKDPNKKSSDDDDDNDDLMMMMAAPRWSGPMSMSDVDVGMSDVDVGGFRCRCWGVQRRCWDVRCRC